MWTTKICLTKLFILITAPGNIPQIQCITFNKHHFANRNCDDFKIKTKHDSQFAEKGYSNIKTRAMHGTHLTST